MASTPMIDDKRDYARCYDHLAPNLYRMALLSLGCPADAHRVVSDAFVTGWREPCPEPDAIASKLIHLVDEGCARLCALNGCAYIESISEAMGGLAEASPYGPLLARLGNLSPETRRLVLFDALFGDESRLKPSSQPI
ncbi:MAG: hypothetical protein RR135_00725 [Oscillospiraceae bacterium]